MKITLTKCASAHVDVDRDTCTKISSNQIADVISVPKNLGIGNAIVFLNDGTSLNVTETIEEINQQLCTVKSYFQFGFGKN